MEAGQVVEVLTRPADGGRAGCETEAVTRGHLPRPLPGPRPPPPRAARACSTGDSVVQLSLLCPSDRSSLFSEVRSKTWFLPLATKMNLSTKIISIYK